MIGANKSNYVILIYIDRDGSNVAPVNVINSVPQKHSEMNCEEVDCEEMNFHRKCVLVPADKAANNVVVV